MGCATDWGDWTLNNTGQLDAGMDDAGADGEDDDEEEEEDDDDTKPDLVSFMVCPRVHSDN